ncbi:hypothetical protein PYW07_006328 [Mythimna separata]|uniref:Uncharacterized protein n=1 Tax=Mythimna separata TaxID=271217 RepID=A0AAD7YW42_MYTSE|nr:hypothetical protein PYW07_006328 [Mythimna separata]
MFDVAPSVKSWEDVPGPRPLPLLGNTWRFTPYIGRCRCWGTLGGSLLTSVSVYTRARSTHAAFDTSMFDVAPSVKSWEDVPGPRPLPLLGNTWRFTPYIGKCIHSREIDARRV